MKFILTDSPLRVCGISSRKILLCGSVTVYQQYQTGSYDLSGVSHGLPSHYRYPGHGPVSVSPGFRVNNCIHQFSAFLGYVVWKIWTSEIKRPRFNSCLWYLHAWSKSLTHSELLAHSEHSRNISPFNFFGHSQITCPGLSEDNQVLLFSCSSYISFSSFSNPNLIWDL